MSGERIFTTRNSWFKVSVGITAGLALAAAAAGMIWLPWTQTAPGTFRIWDAICRAAGVPFQTANGPVVHADYKTTKVVMTPQMLQGASQESVGTGATLALRCTMCHGPQGLSMANSPNLAGQYAPVIFKQLQDYKSGARMNAVMQPIVAILTDQEMQEIAYYYQSLPRLAPVSKRPAPQLVVEGAPMRGIAPCDTCHGGAAHKTGSPWLYGEPYVYLRDQLIAFAIDTRRNDIGEQMRNIARNMTADEIEQTAAYYSEGVGGE